MVALMPKGSLASSKCAVSTFWHGWDAGSMLHQDTCICILLSSGKKSACYKAQNIAASFVPYVTCLDLEANILNTISMLHSAIIAVYKGVFGGCLPCLAQLIAHVLFLTLTAVLNNPCSPFMNASVAQRTKVLGRIFFPYCTFAIHCLLIPLFPFLTVISVFLIISRLLF